LSFAQKGKNGYFAKNGIDIFFVGVKISLLCWTRVWDWKYDNMEGYVEGQSSFEKYIR
jgi:hypothetical protein